MIRINKLILIIRSWNFINYDTDIYIIIILYYYLYYYIGDIIDLYEKIIRKKLLQISLIFK